MRLVLAVCAALLAGPFLQSPARAQGTLRIALREDADILDPTLSSTYVGRIVFAGLCDKLFDIDEKLEIVPQLATGYEWADTKTLMIHLRPGVLFQDGEKLDAEAVKYTFDRYLTMQGSFRNSEISAIDHVEVVDPLTVRVVLKAPSAPFLSQLADRAGMILAPKVAAAGRQEFRPAPGLRGPLQVHRPLAAGSHHAGALRSVLGRQGHPFRQGDLSRADGFLGAPRQP